MEQKTEFRTRDRWLLLAFLLGPLSVLLHQSISYTLVPESCADGSKTILHIVTVVFLLIAASAALVANAIRVRFARTDGLLWQDRTRWFATVSLVLSLASMMVIVAMEIPNWVFGSCQ
jgi:hypothetical protein